MAKAKLILKKPITEIEVDLEANCLELCKEREKGKWVLCELRWDWPKTWECSGCGYRVDLEDGGIYHFCSACGLPMEGEQDGQT